MRCEAPLRALILTVFIGLIVVDVLPFYSNLRGQLWDQIFEDEDSYYVPVGIAAGMLALIIVLVAIAGGRAQSRALRPCPILLHPEILVYAINVLLLAGVVPWWIMQSDADASDLFDGWGYISGWACKIMMGLCLLPIARQSLWLNAAAMGFPEGIAFHRVTGWWCVYQVVIHTVCYTITEALDALTDFTAWKQQLAHNGTTNRSHYNHTDLRNQTRGPMAPGEFDSTKWHAVWVALQTFYWPWAPRLNIETGQPEPNTEGVFILVGLVGTLAAIALAAFSIPCLRRARYDLFYLVHIPAAAFFILMGLVHEFEIMVFVVPGLFAYFLDRTDFLGRTAISRFHKMTARVRLMTGDWLRLDLVGVNSHSLMSEGAFGTQFAYLRIPALGSESHAFSLADRCPSFVIKANGDWTRRLYQLAEQQAAIELTLPTEIDPVTADEETIMHRDNSPMVPPLSSLTTDLTCEIDGVYGNASPPWRAYSHVLFISGGVGVAPWLPAMHEHLEKQRLHSTTAQTMQLVWCGRTRAELDAIGPYLPDENTTVFLTRAAPRTPAVSTVSERSDRDAFESGSDCETDDLTSSRVWAEGESAIALASVQDRVGRKNTRPWLFVSVGVVTLCLSQISYYYIRGAQSVYYEYREDCDKCEPTCWQYLLSKSLPVVFSFVAIAVATIFARWASKLIASLRCPCVTSVEHSSTTTITGVNLQNNIVTARPPCLKKLHKQVKFGRPDLAKIVDTSVTQVGVTPESTVGSITTGLFVCVCGPEAMIKSCKSAVRRARRRHRGVTVGFHAEEPDW